MIMYEKHSNTQDTLPSVGSPECRLMHTENWLVGKGCNSESSCIGVVLNAARAHECNMPHAQEQFREESFPAQGSPTCRRDPLSFIQR